MTEHSIEKLMFKSSDGGVFDTPKARHHLTAKSGWLAFYTSIKFVAATVFAIFVVMDSIRWFLRADGRVWEGPMVNAMLATFGLVAFLALEKSVFWGLRAYQDAIKRNDALEAKIRGGTQDPIYVAVDASEKKVPATKDRLLSLLFVWSKYLVFVIYTGSIGFFTFVLFMEGPNDNPMFLAEAFVLGPVIVFFLARWIIRSEKEIRLAFAGNATLQSDFEALRARNAELESQLDGFEGVSKEETLKLEEKIAELSERVEASEAALSKAQGETESLRKQLATAQGSTSDVERALAEAQRSQSDIEKQLQQEKAARGAVETRLKNLASEFGQNCTVQEAFKALDETVKRKGGLEKLDADGMSLLAKLMRDIRETAPDSFGDAKSLSFVSAEEQRINQYDAIVRLYSQKIQKLRSSDMDEEEQQDAIDAMRRLRDREIAELEGAS